MTKKEAKIEAYETVVRPIYALNLGGYVPTEIFKKRLVGNIQALIEAEVKSPNSV